MLGRGFTMTIEGGRIACIQFSGPWEGDYLAAGEVRVTRRESKLE